MTSFVHHDQWRIIAVNILIINAEVINTAHCAHGYDAAVTSVGEQHIFVIVREGICL